MYDEGIYDEGDIMKGDLMKGDIMKEDMMKGDMIKENMMKEYMIKGDTITEYASLKNDYTILVYLDLSKCRYNVDGISRMWNKP